MLHIKKLTNTLLLLSLVASAPFRLFGVAVEQTAGTAEFGKNITAHAYDPSTGTIYVATGADNGGHTLAKAGRGDTVFTPLAGGAGAISAANAVVLANAGATYAQLPSPLMRFVGDGDKKFLVAINANTTGGATAHKNISLINGQTGVAATTGDLKDANNAAITAAGAATALKLAVGKSSVANQAKAFAYVHTQGQQPGDTNSGVCSATIDLANGTIVADTIGAAKQAQKLDAPTGIPNGGNGGVLGRQDTAAAAQATSGCWVNDLYWDEELQMLYAGLSVRNDTHNDGDQVYALTRAPLATPGGELDAFVKIDGLALAGANGSGPAHLNAAPAAEPSVNTVFAFNGDGTPTNPAAVVQKITGMRTSTNLKYLILNSNVFAAARLNVLDTTAIPHVWAVRLSTANDGTKGNVVKNADGTPLTNNWTGAHLGATLVGGGALPFAQLQNQFVTQLESVGDAVFASIGSRAGTATATNANNKCAIYASRALFGQAGQIIGWTTWERVFPSDSAVFGFAVDPMLGHIWQIGKETTGNTHKVVTRTQWQAVAGNATGATLASRLNHDFAQGCTAVLDIPQGTNGIGAAAAAKSSSLALFGGDGIVAFARTESGQLNAMTTAFNDASNYKLTTLPQGAGYVRALTFSRSIEGATKGYFFAGTDTGLYVFVGDTTTASPVGYNGSNLALDLNGAAPFTANAGWIRMDAALAGAVTALDAIGSHLFAIEHDYSQPGSVTCRLIRYDIGADVNATVGSRVIIAASGQTTIPANTLFNDFAIVCDDGDRAHARGLLATNIGIFQSPAATALVGLGADANWVLIPNTDASLLTTMIKTNKRVMAGDDGKALSPMIAYLDGSGNSWHEMYLKHLAPTWNANAISATAQFGYALQGAANAATQRLVNFWTDGARRFYSEINNTDLATGDELKSCPFSPALFGMTNEETITANTTPAHIFWIENISGIGEVMVGTEFGVLSLN